MNHGLCSLHVEGENFSQNFQEIEAINTIPPTVPKTAILLLLSLLWI